MKEHVSHEKILNEASKELKNTIKQPEWAPFVKTGSHKERAPQQEDWWYMRAASVLRTVERGGPVGVNKLRTKYGGKKNRGVKPGRFKKGSGNILRTILQQLEQAQLLRTEDKGVHKGRVITAQGKNLLNDSQKKVLAVTKKPVEQKPEPIAKAPKTETPKQQPKEEPKTSEAEIKTETLKEEATKKEETPKEKEKPDTKTETPKEESKPKEEPKKQEVKPEPKIEIPKEEPKLEAKE